MKSWNTPADNGADAADEGIKALLREAVTAKVLTGWYPHLRCVKDAASENGYRMDRCFTINPANADSRILSRDEALDYCTAVAALLTPTPDSL